MASGSYRQVLGEKGFHPPLIKVEDSINALLGESYASVAVSIADSAKGERLVAFFTDPDLASQEGWERLCHTELPRLWIPKRDGLHFIESVPILGTGKVDLRAVQRLAMDLGGAAIS